MSDVQLVEVPDTLKKADIQVIRFWAHDAPEFFVDQLLQKSRQPHITEHTSDICRDDACTSPGRFASRQSYDTWATQKRLVYAMVGGYDAVTGTGDVGGVVWFGERKHPDVPDSKLTFAIRNYAGDDDRGWGTYVGRGFGRPFMGVAHQDMYTASSFAGSSVWLSVETANEAAAHVYQKFGYQQIVDDGTRIVMVWKP